MAKKAVCKDVFGIDLRVCGVSEEELNKERNETYEIFKKCMLDVNPSYTEEIIREAFVSKFSYKF